MLKLTDIGRVSDERLVEDILNGSQKAMKKVYDRWSGYLLAICTRYIPDKDIAEDILQDSFVKIFSSIGSFKSKGEGAFKAWISRITVNEALMYLRKQKRCNFIEFQDHLPDIPEDAEPDIENIPAAEIQKMIQSLSDGYRTIFNLVALEGKSHKEVAELLGITESTSASQFHRARKILAKKIIDYNKRNDAGTARK